MRDLTVLAVQCELAWEQPGDNRRLIGQMIEQLAESTDLVVLPEMFTTGFSMNALELAQDMNGPAVAWMRNAAEHNRVDIAGIDIDSVEMDFPHKPESPDQVIHAVDTFEYRAFTTAGTAEDNKHLTALDIKVEIFHNGVVVVPGK